VNIAFLRWSSVAVVNVVKFSRQRDVNGNRILTIWRQLNIDQLIGHFGSLVSRLVRPPVCWRGSFSVVPALRRR